MSNKGTLVHTHNTQHAPLCTPQMGAWLFPHSWLGPAITFLQPLGCCYHLAHRVRCMLVDVASLDCPDTYEPREALATDISTRVGSCHDSQEGENRFYTHMQTYSCLKELFVTTRFINKRNNTKLPQSTNSSHTKQAIKPSNQTYTHI